MTHTITILGSTGSIGRQTLSVAEELGLRVAALTAEKNVDLLEAQCRKYRPELAVMTENAAAEELKTRLADMNIRVLAGSEALCEAAALPQADTVVAAVCGFAALRPTLTAIREKKRIALANKETMVCAGHHAPDPDLLRRAVLREKPGRTGVRDQSGRPAPPQLEDGREDHHRLRHAHEQGAGDHRGHAAV